MILDGRGLSAPLMQAIAKEMNFSETTFVLPPDRSDTDLRVRIFTPGSELPMAGHPTIGTAFALARAGVLGPDRRRVVFGLGVGPTDVYLEWGDDRLVAAYMTQLKPRFERPFPDVAGVAAALGLPANAVTSTGLPAQTVSCGFPCLLVPLATRDVVDRAAFDGAAYASFRLSAGIDDLPLFLFCPEPGSDEVTAYARMFAPGIGIAEDPATGGAAGPVGCYLVAHKIVPVEKAASMLILQGVKMGRPSHIHVAVTVTDGDITSVRVGGMSIVAGEGTLYV